ncbi:hypothetical protein H4R19_003830 [Coemansia spiralis]|nr:hypothetical protein H4R19_003830 [Coemansia spiralis]
MAKVRCYSDDMPLLRQAVFPMQLTSFEILAPGARFTLLDGVEMPRVERLIVKFIGPVVKPDAVATANCFLHRVRGCRHKELIIHSANTVVTPELNTCAELTSLTLGANVSMDEVFAFIGRLPCLLTLRFIGYVARGTQADISITSLDAHERVEPLNASLQSLRILLSDDWSENDMAAVVKYLVLRLPRLAFFPAYQIPRSPVIAFARAYAHIYPHLANATNVLVSSR